MAASCALTARLVLYARQVTSHRLGPGRHAQFVRNRSGNQPAQKMLVGRCLRPEHDCHVVDEAAAPLLSASSHPCSSGTTFSRKSCDPWKSTGVTPAAKSREAKGGGPPSSGARSRTLTLCIGRDGSRRQAVASRKSGSKLRSTGPQSSPKASR